MFERPLTYADVISRYGFDRTVSEVVICLLVNLAASQVSISYRIVDAPFALACVESPEETV